MKLVIVTGANLESLEKRWEGMGKVFEIVRMSGFREWVWNLNGMSSDGRKCIGYWFENFG